MWITVDVDLGDHPKIAELPNDSARWGWLLTLLEAKRQKKPGRFASERHYRAVLHRYAKYLPHYRSLRLLEDHEDGSLSIHDWERHQWAVRQARHRENDSGTGTLPQRDESVTSELLTRAVPVSVDVSSKKEPRARLSADERSVLVVACSECGAPVGAPCEGVRSERNGEPWKRWAIHRPRWEMAQHIAGLDDGEAEVFAFLAEHGASIREDKPLGLRLISLMERRTSERVLETAWDMARHNGKLSDRQWVFGLEGRLEPIESGAEATKRERKAELERVSARGFEQTQRYLKELRGEA